MNAQTLPAGLLQPLLTNNGNPPIPDSLNTLLPTNHIHHIPTSSSNQSDLNELLAAPNHSAQNERRESEVAFAARVPEAVVPPDAPSILRALTRCFGINHPAIPETTGQTRRHPSDLW